MKPTPYVYEWDRRVRSRKYHRKATFNGCVAFALLVGMLPLVAFNGPWQLFAVVPLVGLVVAIRAGFCYAVARYAEKGH